MKKSSLFLFCIFINIYSAEQPFPIENLPLDIQNLIAYFLDWRELENESLLTHLNSVAKQNPSSETKNHQFSLDKDKNFITITNKNNKNSTWYNFNSLEPKWWHIISFNSAFLNDTLQILMGFKQKRKIIIFDFNNRTIETNILPETDIFNTFAYHNKKGFALIGENTIQLSTLKNPKNPFAFRAIKEIKPIKLEDKNPNTTKIFFNSQGTKLAVSSKNNETAIIALNCNQENFTLQEYFRRKQVCKNLKHANSCNN